MISMGGDPCLLVLGYSILHTATHRSIEYPREEIDTSISLFVSRKMITPGLLTRLGRELPQEKKYPAGEINVQGYKNMQHVHTLVRS